MFNVWLDYPSYAEELNVVKRTTTDAKVTLKNVVTAEQIIAFQQLVRKVPVADNVYEYAVKLAASSRPNTALSTPKVNEYVNWGAGPRASQFLVIGAKCHAALNGKFSPDIEDVRAVANPILRHRIVKNYKAEAEGVTVEDIIAGLLGQ